MTASSTNLAEIPGVEILDPKKLCFYQEGLALCVELDGRRLTKVKVIRAFPLSDPDRYLGLRDAENKELGFIANLGELEEGSRELVKAELQRRYFSPAIVRVLSAEHRFGTIDWEVETNRGFCHFTTRNLRENVAHLDPGRYIITDIEGNRFDVRLDAVDEASRAKLLCYI